jgi:ATP-dependent DNA helicase RecG
LFFAQILVYLRKANYRFQKSVAFIGGDKATEALKQKIPFSLTAAQQKVVDEIIADLGKKRPMHRLLQGDVGSGKTIVACFAINIVVSGRYQAAIMAPTEVLAQQHYRSLRKIFKAFNFNIALLTSSTTNRRKKEIYQNLASGEIDIIIGTHALLSANIEFHKLGLVIIDEQHKFGVAQRTLLPKKGQGVVAHCLVMSATPIPRSLALSFYGDLDLSIIDQLPPGRKQPRTYWVNNRRRRWVYDFMRQHLNQGRQAYVVYPLIVN